MNIVNFIKVIYTCFKKAFDYDRNTSLSIFNLLNAEIVHKDNAMSTNIRLLEAGQIKPGE